MKQIILAGGCFWGVEHYYSRLKGVLRTEVGYTDGPTLEVTYQEVCNSSGHVEAVLVEYDEALLPLEKVLDHFFRIIDPTQWNRQGNDIGIQYRSAVFYQNETEKLAIEAFIQGIQPSYKKPIRTVVKPISPFYPAELYHQHYLVKNPTGYCHINMLLAKPEELK